MKLDLNCVIAASYNKERNVRRSLRTPMRLSCSKVGYVAVVLMHSDVHAFLGAG